MHFDAHISLARWLELIISERFGHPFSLSFESTSSLVMYLQNDPRNITFDIDRDTFTSSNPHLPCTQWNAVSEGWLSVLDSPLPAPGVVSLPSPLITRTPMGMHVAYDILGLTYWMLSRQEEVGRSDLDKHGRFPATASHGFKYDYLDRPVVDEWLSILGQVVQRTWPGIELKQNCFSMKVSHDVDSPSRYGFRNFSGLVRAMAGDVIKRGDLGSAVLAPWIRMNTRNQLHSYDPDNTFNWIMNLSEQHGLHSAFYFICGYTDPHDADYSVEHPAIRHLMRQIHQRGHEIGLHPSYGCYKKPHLILQEADQLRKICALEDIKQKEWGGRMHYLRWEQPTTLRAWADAGMGYDSTMSYADLPGFRCGTCFEYPAFDPVTQEALPLRIRPLIAMECSVISSLYMGLGTGMEALEVFTALKNTCRAVGGSFTLLWHNSEIKRSKELYRKVLIA